MLDYILLAIFLGFIVSISRSLNGLLANFYSPFMASFYNHLIGFIFMCVIVLGFGVNINTLFRIPMIYYFCGIIGILFITINSFVSHKIGATKTIILVTAAQLFASLLISRISILLAFKQIVGIMFIIFSIVLKNYE